MIYWIKSLLLIIKSGNKNPVQKVSKSNKINSLLQLGRALEILGSLKESKLRTIQSHIIFTRRKLLINSRNQSRKSIIKLNN